MSSSEPIKRRREDGGEADRQQAPTLIIVGVQVLFSSFVLSILGLRRRDAV
jgi:hypothetical protein